MQDIAYVLATGYVGLSILLSGVFVRPSQLKIPPLLWLSYISYPRCVLSWPLAAVAEVPLPFNCMWKGCVPQLPRVDSANCCSTADTHREWLRMRREGGSSGLIQVPAPIFQISSAVVQ